MLEEAAKASGRSLAQEVEHRLERSFDQSQLTGALLEVRERIRAQIEDMQAKIKAEMQREVADLRQTLQDIRDKEIAQVQELRVLEQRVRDEQTIPARVVPSPIHVVPNPIRQHMLRLVRERDGEAAQASRIVGVVPREPSLERRPKLLENKR
jgi:hypothetical protein